MTGEEEWRGEGELRLSDGRRAKRAKVKRGRRSSCGRARRWRGNLVNSTNKGMSPNDLLDTMQRKQEGIKEYTNAELDEMAGKSPEEQGAERVEAAKVKERRTVMNTKVPTHGTWRKNEREDEDVTFMGVNINSLAYWSKESNKAARLKYVFHEYGVDAAGMQEVCVNWAKLPQSKSLANSLRAAAENIRSVASHNKGEGEAKGMW